MTFVTKVVTIVKTIMRTIVKTIITAAKGFYKAAKLVGKVAKAGLKLMGRMARGFAKGVKEDLGIKTKADKEKYAKMNRV